jgi:gamma-glutamyltranspeptidase/glutathione hydrolase
MCVGLTAIALVSATVPAQAEDELLPGSQATGSHGAVSAGGAEAVAAGIEILKRGGNAADAGAATILALSVTDSGGFCFGGEVPILVYDARRRVVEVLAGQGAAPRLATREYFASRGGIPGKGIEPAAVPAAFDACLTLLERYGTLRLTDVAEPALRLLDRAKVEWHPLLARSIRRLIAAESNSGGDRSRGLRLAADYFYRGPLAHELADWCAKNGGLIRYEDLATHVTLEAMKLAFADRDVYYADPLFVDVPLAALLSRGYAETRRALIDREHASLEQRPGDPRKGRPLLDESEKRRGLAGPRSRHDHLHDGRSLGQCRRRDPQRLERRAGGGNRHLARNAAAELQHLGRTSQLHRSRQATADHAHAHAGP